jgi:hypothetical protein
VKFGKEEMKLIKDGSGSDSYENEFKYFGYPSFYFLPVSILRMKTDRISMETNSDILNINDIISFTGSECKTVGTRLSMPPPLLPYPSPRWLGRD